jgi:hypothetical protein
VGFDKTWSRADTVVRTADCSGCVYAPSGYLGEQDAFPSWSLGGRTRSQEQDTTWEEQDAFPESGYLGGRTLTFPDEQAAHNGDRRHRLDGRRSPGGPPSTCVGRAGSSRQKQGLQQEGLPPSMLSSGGRGHEESSADHTSQIMQPVRATIWRGNFPRRSVQVRGVDVTAMLPTMLPSVEKSRIQLRGKNMEQWIQVAGFIRGGATFKAWAIYLWMTDIHGNAGCPRWFVPVDRNHRSSPR